MEITGALQTADGLIDYITAHGETYENTMGALEAALPDGTKLMAIRKDS